MVFAENTGGDTEEVVYYEQYFPPTIDAFVNAKRTTRANNQRRPLSPSLLVEKLRREYDNLWPVSAVHREDISLGTQLSSLADFL